VAQDLGCWGDLRCVDPVEHVLDDFLEYGRVQLVPNALPIALGQHEPGVPEDAEMSRDGRPRGREAFGNLAGRARSCSQELEDFATSGVGEGAEDVVHSVN